MHVQRRGAVYQWRRRIPNVLVVRFGAQELTRSLMTTERKAALKAARQLSVACDKLFETVFEDVSLARNDVRSLVQEWLDEPDCMDSQKVHITGADQQFHPHAQSRLPKPSQLLKQYASERVQDGKWREDTKRKTLPKLELFVRTIGDLHLEDVTRTHVRAYRDALVEGGLSASTIRLHFSCVSALFNWSRDELQAQIENPMRGLAPSGKGQGRRVYTRDELKRLFASPLFTGHWRRDRRERPGALLVKDHKYWLPLIALHSGMRVEEIAQLHKDDVCKVDGVWCFNVRKSKTPSGERIIPIHLQLIELGFLDYHASMSDGHLWPLMALAKDGRHSHSFVKWWGQYLKLIGLKQKGLVFHSFRHTFVSELERLGVPENEAAQICGHAHKSITYGIYGGKLLSPKDKLSRVDMLRMFDPVKLQ